MHQLESDLKKRMPLKIRISCYRCKSWHCYRQRLARNLVWAVLWGSGYQCSPVLLSLTLAWTFSIYLKAWQNRQKEALVRLVSKQLLIFMPNSIFSFYLLLLLPCQRLIKYFRTSSPRSTKCCNNSKV